MMVRLRTGVATAALVLLLGSLTCAQLNQQDDLFHCPEDWTLKGQNCYRFFNIRHSWEKAAALCKRYGSDLVLVESYGQNNFTETLAHEGMDEPTNSYWLGLMSLNNLSTNTLESAGGDHVSLYSGFWSQGQPQVSNGECVKAKLSDQRQSWELSTCESLLPFMCRVQACTKGSIHCSNGNCINEAFKCDGQNDCGDMSDEMNCRELCHFYTKSSGESIESPEYPKKYGPNIDCKWTLEGPVGHNVILQFFEFDTEKNFDTVQILSGGRTEDSAVSLTTLSGRQDLTDRLFISASNFMILKFKSDASVEKRGFRASWKTEPQDCGGELIATPQEQIMTSYNYPLEYPGGLECLYTLKTQQGRVITLEVLDLDLEDDNDFILIRDGNSPSSAMLGRLTGSMENNPRFIISTGPVIYFYFHTSLGISKRGFRIKYYSGCSVNIKAFKGVISSPAFGISDYPSNQECRYLIKRPGGGPLSLKFNEFDVEEKDSVQVYDGLTSSQSIRLHSNNGFTAKNLPTITLTADSGALFLIFNTDPLRPAKGWSANFSADCPMLAAGEGAIASSRDTSFDSVVTYSCPKGQEFANNKSSIVTTCMPGGQWSTDYIPSCQVVYCGPVPQIDNGFSTNATNVTYEGRATYQCYAGFGFRSGAPMETIRCSENGQWDRLPECLASQCSPLPETPYATQSILNGGGQSYGTVVRYECEPGYFRTGLPVIHCMSNGSWSGEVPSCSRIRCYDYPEVENGFVTDLTRDYYFGDEARVLCYRGYKLIGDPIITCGPNQTFVNVPTCEDINECEAAQCDVASTECKNTPGAFSCMCKAGFTANLDCRPRGDLGVSDGGIPDDAITVSSTALGYEKNSVRLNSQPGWCGAVPTPNENWVMVDLRVPTVIIGFRTQPVGRLDGQLAFAKSISLYYTNDLTDVFHNYTNSDGSSVEFRVTSGASLSVVNLPTSVEARYIRLVIADYKEAPCLKFELMGCARQDCMDINECEDNNGSCDQRCINSPGSFSCLCNLGYELFTDNGTAGHYTEHSETGLRDGDSYRLNKTCVEKMCPALESPPNGVLLSTQKMYHYGDLVKFQCHFGYVMVGSDTLTCTSNGIWNGTLPECRYAVCPLLQDNPVQGLTLNYNDHNALELPFKQNVTITCNQEGLPAKKTMTSKFRECVYDPQPGTPEYWLSGIAPECPRVDCGEPAETPGATYGFNVDTMFQSSFFFGCEETFSLAGQTRRNDNAVRCQSDANWDFGDLRCEGPVCSDPGHPPDGIQISTSYEQGSQVKFACTRPGYIPIIDKPIRCMREPECRVVAPLGITSGKIPDSAINATTERGNYEAHNIRLNSATGWCGQEESFTYVTVDLGKVHRVKAILVKGVITNDVIGRPTEIRFFYKEKEDDNYIVYFPNFNLTARDPGNYGELAMITLPTVVTARFVILGLVSYDENRCLKFELMGCEDEPPSQRLLGFDMGYPVCVDNEPPQFANCPNNPIIVQKGTSGIQIVNFTVPTAFDNSGMIARTEIKPAGFRPPMHIFEDMMVEYYAFDFDGNVAICQINITVPDDIPPSITCPQSYVIELVEQQENYRVNFNSSLTLRNVNVSDNSGEYQLKIMPEVALIPVGGYENVTIVATDPSGNTAFCNFQVAVQATACVDWELKEPANGKLVCNSNPQGAECSATCNTGFRFTDNMSVKSFTCTEENQWQPSRVVPDCVREDTEEASYDVIADIMYRANGAVEPSCLPQYDSLLNQYYDGLNSVLSSRCSAAANVAIDIRFHDTQLEISEANMVHINFVVRLTPDVKRTNLYELCGFTLSLIFDLSVSSSSAVIDSIINLSSAGNACPPMRATNSSVTRGFTCNVGEVLNTKTGEVPRCLHCPAGTYAPKEEKQCSPCKSGFYQDQSRQGSCKQCPAGTYTRTEGSKSSQDCIPVCGYGTYSPTGLVPCLNCPQNSYTEVPPIDGFKECQACPPETFTHAASTSSQQLCRQKCRPGYYSDNGLEPCAPCPLNFYQTQIGSVTCEECATGNRTLEEGSSSAEDCKAVSCSEGICQNGGLCLSRQHQAQCYCPAGFTGRFCEVDVNECGSQPCYNEGTCIDIPQGYRCECPEGYTGLQCQNEISECAENTCPDRAMCKDDPGMGTYDCLCRSGYTGPGCNITVNPCAENGNPCSNSAACNPLDQGRFHCECLPGWEGRLCEENINDCAESPCLLNANCTDLINDFRCDCPTGFEGKRCHIKVDLCNSQNPPCANGICVDRFFSHECICHPGWAGERCDVNIDECESAPCVNGGRCVDKINGFHCACDKGYTGKTCQHTIDDCASEPCQNGGTCVDKIDGVVCKCRPGFVGLQCEAPTDECSSNPCNPVGTQKCLDLDNMFKCKCHPGYEGEFCENNINECASNPCHNGGICTDGVDDFACTCNPGWSGKRCEHDIGGCENTPCLNDAECINLFEDYFCVCPSGTDGKRCQVTPERCVGEPCMNGASCKDYGSGLNCTCSEDFTGIGCQYEFDACEAGLCENGATCVDRGAGYECVCPPGYTGRHCDQDIMDCTSTSCPPGATCIDLTNDFYCKCPFNLTGEDCRKVINIDYELYINDESKASSASLATPFRIGGATSFTLALWIQFANADDLGTIFTLYSVTSPYIPSNKRVMLQATNAGIAIEFFEDMKEFVTYRTNIPVNDGQWHHMALVWDGKTGSLTLTTDAVVVAQVDEFGQGRSLPMYGWLSLGSVDNEFAGYTNERGFHGRVARLNAWNKPLDFRTEIPKMVRSCMNSPVMFEGLLLRWSGYDKVTGNVERVGPSTCGQYICPPGYTGDCTVLERDKKPPRVDHCPGDIWVITRNGSAVVDWDMPVFSDNIGIEQIIDKSGYSPGQAFTWGTYHVASVAYDAAGNSATCSFNIYVLEEFCPKLEDPLGGVQRCSDWGPGGRFQVCKIECYDGSKFSTQVPDFYTCGAEGFWRPTPDPSYKLVYPACAPSVPAQRVFNINMEFPSSVICNAAGQNVLSEKIRVALNKLNADWNFCTNTISSSGVCNDLDVAVDCSRRNRLTREAPEDRERRQASQEADDVYKVKITFPSVNSRTRRNSDQNYQYNVEVSFQSKNDPVQNKNTDLESTVLRLIEGIILEKDEFDVRDALPNVVPDPSSLKLTSEYSCPAGKVVVDSDCVDCAPGQYYEEQSKVCKLCESGTYQNELGQITCKSCPERAGRQGVTKTPGSRSVEDCQERCAAGRYFDGEISVCRSCGYGYYQPEEGKFSCKRCDRGLTTRTKEAVSASECREECESGLQLGTNGLCEPCSRGTYRTKGIHAACVRCPEERTTVGAGSSTVEECSIRICSAGQFLSDMNSTYICLPCPKGTYQPEALQSICIDCPQDTSTDEVGATSLDACSNPCEVDGDQQHCASNALCLFIAETNDFECQCKPGFNGSGKVCNDMCENFCDNNGLCKKNEDGSPYCVCSGSFTGKKCMSKTNFTYIAGGIAGAAVFLILIALLVWMICIRATRRREPKKGFFTQPSTDPNGSQVNFYYGAPAAYAESIAPSHHSTYAHYYDDEEDAWEMPNFYNETYMKTGFQNGAGNSLARSNASIYGNKEDLYDRLRKHAYQGKKDKDETGDSDDQVR